MDNASDYGSEDSRFESWQVRKPVLRVTWCRKMKVRIMLSRWHMKITEHTRGFSSNLWDTLFVANDAQLSQNVNLPQIAHIPKVLYSQISLFGKWWPRLQYQCLSSCMAFPHIKWKSSMQKNHFSRAWFRSTDLWVMGPARFHCATLLHSWKEHICCFERSSKDLMQQSANPFSQGSIVPTLNCSKTTYTQV